jgi:glycosyltransferase involved in cell wall biosynthesis
MTQQPPQGGTEIIMASMLDQIPSHYWEKINFIMSVCDFARIDPTKKNVLFQQLSYDQPLAQNMGNPEFVDKLDCIVFVSHWMYEKFRRVHSVPAYKSVIIPNSTHRCAYVPRNNQMKRLVYTSTPWRGLETLLDAYDMLDRQDVHLDVFSSTLIYGTDFYASEDATYQPLWDKCHQHPRITLHGFQPNSVVRDHVAAADIFAYPNTWEEGFCISALEALIAGCKVVTTSHGALPEVCGPWATYVPYGENRQILALRYAHALNDAINACPYDGRAQSVFYNSHYTWDQVIPQWCKLFDNLLEGNQ